MKLNEFIKNHYDDYAYLEKSNGGHICDMMIKFLPYWVLVTYGECEIDFQCLQHGCYNVYKIIVQE